MQLKKKNLSVSRPPQDLSACAEHAPVLARQCRSLQADRHVSHMLDQKTYQVLQHISQRRQCESHKEEQQRCNSDQLNIPIKKKKKRGGVGCRR